MTSFTFYHFKFQIWIYNFETDQANISVVSKDTSLSVPLNGINGMWKETQRHQQIMLHLLNCNCVAVAQSSEAQHSINNARGNFATWMQYVYWLLYFKAEQKNLLINCDFDSWIWYSNWFPETFSKSSPSHRLLIKSNTSPVTHTGMQKAPMVLKLSFLECDLQCHNVGTAHTESSVRRSHLCPWNWKTGPLLV